MRRAGCILLLSLALIAMARAADDAAREKGRVVYQKWCAPCHGAGLGKPGTIASAAHNRGAKPAVLEERADLTAKMIESAVRNGTYAMPRFRKTEISNVDLDAIVAHLTRK